MQLRIFITILLFGIHGLTFGQRSLQKNSPFIVNAKAFATLQEKVFASYLSLDSNTAANVNDKGVIFFKFNIVRGTLKNLKHTGSAPIFLTQSITTYLLSMDDITLSPANVDKNEVFILPIKFDYRIVNPAKTIAELLKKLPNANSDNEKFAFEDFNSLFGLDGKNMYGVKCMLLTPLEISRPID